MSTGIFAGNVKGITVLTATVDLGSVAANTSEIETATVTGVKAGDAVIAIKPTLEAGLIVGTAYVTADDTVSIQVGNFTGSAIDAASETWQFIVLRNEAASVSRVIK